MVFSSFLFLAYFLPFFFVTYFLVPDKYKNFTLFVYSICFYAFGCFETPYYILILIASLIVNYSAAIIIHNTKSKFILFIALIYNFSILFLYKYYDFFLSVIGIVNSNLKANKLNLILPIGISFYTFQLVSYVIDVYYEKIEPEKSFIDFGTYAIMFPQLIAGPIVRFTDIVKEIKSKRNIDVRLIFDGVSIFVFGLTCKVFLANQLSMIKVDADYYDIQNIKMFETWLIGIAYSLQMYFDFFGYSLMAIGLGKVMGFTIPINFNDPFLSRSVEEYWRRWHITLSTWFRDYVLYPILLSPPFKAVYSILNKIIKNRKVVAVITNIPATFVVWFATGLWHGANYNYIIWGLYFFILMGIEQIFLSKFLKKHKIISHIYLIIVIIISFVIFFTEDIAVLKIYLKNMFTIDKHLFGDAFITMIKNNYKVLILALLTVLRLPQSIYSIIKTNLILKILIVLLLLIVDLIFIHIGYNDPFLYFRF